MKPGDKVWVFDSAHQKIITEKAIDVSREAVVAGHFPGHIGLYRIGVTAFPTREELCEHYRKIFE